MMKDNNPLNLYRSIYIFKTSKWELINPHPATPCSTTGNHTPLNPMCSARSTPMSRSIAIPLYWSHIINLSSRKG